MDKGINTWSIMIPVSYTHLIFFSIKRPFYQSTQKLFLAPIPYTPYREFAKKLFDERKKTLQEFVNGYIAFYSRLV